MSINIDSSLAELSSANGISYSYNSAPIVSSVKNISSSNGLSSFGGSYGAGISSGSYSAGISSGSYGAGISSGISGGAYSSGLASFGGDYSSADASAFNSSSINSYSAAGSGGRSCKFLAQLPLDQYKLMEDPNPEIIRKKPSEKLNYRQEVAIRFLEPPQLPNPGPIVVRQLPNRQIAPAPPLVVRQAPPKPPTPPPIVIREAPPVPPANIGDKLVTIPGKVIPPPARKVVVEKLPPIPAKPQQVLIEKWLPFKPQKRRVVFQKAEPDCVLPNPRNLVIQWEAPEVEVRREVKNLGVTQANPEDYVRRHGGEVLRYEEFRSAAARVGAPENVLVANRQLGLAELEGDVQALRLVNLESAGLTEYREYLGRLGINGSAQITSTHGLITSENMGNLLSIDEAERTINNLNAGSEKITTDGDLRAYFNSLDVNRDGVVDFNEFRAGAQRLGASNMSASFSYSSH